MTNSRGTKAFKKSKKSTQEFKAKNFVQAENFVLHKLDPPILISNLKTAPLNSSIRRFQG